MAYIELKKFDNGKQLKEEEPGRERLLSSQHNELHSETGELLKSIVYGALDGSTGTIIILLSGISSRTIPIQVYGIAMAALIAHAFCMGFGDYLSAKAEIEFILEQKDNIMKDIEINLEGEKAEVVAIYSTSVKGHKEPMYSKQDAIRVTDLLSKSKEALANLIMLNKVHRVPNEISAAVKCGIATFFACFFFGIIPILPYFINMNEHWLYSVLCISIVELFSLGYAKGAVIGINTIKSGYQVLFLGFIISVVGYAIGLMFEA